jgi:hypothetical protein
LCEGVKIKNFHFKKKKPLGQQKVTNTKNADPSYNVTSQVVVALQGDYTLMTEFVFFFLLV